MVATRSASSPALSHAEYLRRLKPPEERRAIRVRAGVSQSQIARELGVSTSVVGLWERGERGLSHRTIGPYVELLDALARITEEGPLR